MSKENPKRMGRQGAERRREETDLVVQNRNREGESSFYFPSLSPFPLIKEQEAVGLGGILWPIK